MGLKTLKEKLPTVINKILFATINEVTKLVGQEFNITEDKIQVAFDELRTESKIIFPYEGTKVAIIIKPEEFYLEEECSQE